MKCSTDSSELRAQGSEIKTYVFSISALCVLSSELAEACPLCKEALTLGMAKGFYWSILLMLSVPAAVVAVIAGAVWRSGQKRRAPPDAHRGQSS